MSLFEQSIRPNLSCGLGQNLYIEPSGESFPCYAYHKKHSLLGNVFEEGLSQIIKSKRFKELCFYNVNSIEKCKECHFRYLCGGACRAWGGVKAQYRLGIAPNDCKGLQERAEEILYRAKNYLIND